MITEFIPKFSNSKEKYKAISELINNSIRAKAYKEIEEMSLEDKTANHYTAITPEVPKTKKGIDKAIDTFIKDFSPQDDKGEELLSFIGFYDIGEGVEPGEWTKRAEYLRSKIAYRDYKEDGDRQIIEILDKADKVIGVVKEYLQTLTVEELYNLSVFGIVVTEEEAKENIEVTIKVHTSNADVYLVFYAVGKYLEALGKEPEDAITYSAKKQYEILRKLDPDATDEPEKINEYKKRVEECLTAYPKEAIAYCRGYTMIQNNFSERAIIATVKHILNNEL